MGKSKIKRRQDYADTIKIVQFATLTLAATGMNLGNISGDNAFAEQVQTFAETEMGTQIETDAGQEKIFLTIEVKPRTKRDKALLAESVIRLNTKMQNYYDYDDVSGTKESFAEDFFGLIDLFPTKEFNVGAGPSSV